MLITDTLSNKFKINVSLKMRIKRGKRNLLINFKYWKFLLPYNISFNKEVLYFRKIFLVYCRL